MEYEPVKIGAKELVKEGTIVVTRRNPATDIFMDKILKFVHLGIVAVENGEFIVYDLHPDNKNNENGSLDKKPLGEYLKGRNLIGIYHTGATTGRIQAVAKKCWKGKYNTYYFHCQQFIDYVTHKQISSDVYSYYSGLVLAMGGVLGLIAVGGAIYLLSGKEGKK
jgi:hypothetical protein